MTLCPERLALQRAVEALGDRHATLPMTAGEARAESLKCARHINVCLDAGEYAEARRQLDEAKRFALLAIELERKVG